MKARRSRSRQSHSRGIGGGIGGESMDWEYTPNAIRAQLLNERLRAERMAQIHHELEKRLRRHRIDDALRRKMMVKQHKAELKAIRARDRKRDLELKRIADHIHRRHDDLHALMMSMKNMGFSEPRSRTISRSSSGPSTPALNAPRPQRGAPPPPPPPLPPRLIAPAPQAPPPVVQQPEPEPEPEPAHRSRRRNGQQFPQDLITQLKSKLRNRGGAIY